MGKINHLHIKGFRRLFDVDIQVRPLMVMIGANGVGKTSMLDTFDLISNSAAGTLNMTLTEMGGITNIMTSNDAKELSFSIDMNILDFEPLKYDLHITPKGHSYTISSEKLSQQREKKPTPFIHIESHYGDIRYFDVEKGKLFRPNWEHNPNETSLCQVPKMFRQSEELRRILSSATLYHCLDVGSRAPVKLPQSMKPADLPGHDGEDLVPFLYNLRESNSDRFEAILDTLRAAFPGFDQLNFPSVAAGMLTLTWKDKNFNKPHYLHQLSEGILRFLWLVSLLQSPGLSTVTMIDEPEVSLHPELLSLLVELMREASQRTQLIIATHSDRIVRFLRPDEVIVMDVNDDGCASAVWADTMDIDQWLSEYSLDEVWRLGRIGGRA